MFRRKFTPPNDALNAPPELRGIGYALKIWRRRVLVAFLLLAFCLFILPEPFRTFSTSLRWGGMQVLAGPDELWCFVQIDQCATTSAPLSPSGRPRERIHSQEVIVVSKSGEVRRIRVPRQDAVTFHRNVSTIFRHAGEFNLLRDPHSRRALYRWENGRFKRLPRHQLDAIVRSYALHDFHYDVDGLDRVTESSRWTRLPARYQADSFEWDGMVVEIRDRSRGHEATLELESGVDPQWTVELVKFRFAPRPISCAQFKAFFAPQR